VSQGVAGSSPVVLPTWYSQSTSREGVCSMTAWRKSLSCQNTECVEAAPVAADWRKARYSFSHGNCVEALPTGAAWQKAAAIYANGNCVEAVPAGAAWQKAASSLSNGNCVEAAHTGSAAFTKAAASAIHNCLEAQGGPTVLVRDSKDPDGPHLHFTPDEWQVMLAVTQQGERVFTEVNLRAKEGQRTFTLTADSDDDVLY
jgi:Domain of unknown function (DUF397)